MTRKAYTKQGWSLAQRLEFRSMPEPNSGCTLWLGAINSKGYGILKHQGLVITAHRTAYEVANGPVPPGKVVMHKCDNTACLHPAHLCVGTVADNSADMCMKGRSNRGVKHGKAKLSEAVVLAILNDSRGAAALSRAMGIPASTIGGIQRGDRWKHMRALRARADLGNRRE